MPSSSSNSILKFQIRHGKIELTRLQTGLSTKQPTQYICSAMGEGTVLYNTANN